MTAFDECLPVILREEGGYVDDLQDPGGITNLGVTQANWSTWIGRRATDADMRALTPALVAPFYRVRYWQATSCDSLPLPLALCVFDFAVNGGDGRSARYLQRMVNVDQDGHIGIHTIAAVTAYIAAKGWRGAVAAYQEERKDYYRNLPKFPHFGTGWLNRVAYVSNAAMALA
jgi:lysozyme family protein